MSKILITTSIEEKVYAEFKKNIGSKKINQAIQEHMESVNIERKKAKA